MAENNKDMDQNRLVGYQQAQNQLLAIQEQQRQNILNAKLENNQNISARQVAQQASGIMMANQQDLVNIALNSQTKDILNKYGLNKPQTIRSSQKVGQNVIINNNTTNNYGGPVQGRNLSFSDPEIILKKQQEESGRLKNWLNSIFAKQANEDAVRNKIFEKKERELDKTSRNVVKKLGDLGKNLMSSLSPKRIISTMNGGLKKLLFIFGMHLIAKNWVKILDFATRIEDKVKGTLDYFGITSSNGAGGTGKVSNFVKDIQFILGGKDAVSNNKSILEIFKDILIGSDENDSKSLWGHIKLYFSQKAQERSEALKQLPGPVFDKDSIKNIPGLISSAVEYLGSVLSVLVSGSNGLKKGIGKNINAKAALSSKAYQEMFRDEYKTDVLGEGIISKTATDWNKKTVDLTKEKVVKSGIDASTMAVAQGTYMGQHSSNLDLSGNINKTADATLGQGAELARQLNEAGHGKINTAGIMRSFDQLSRVSDNTLSTVLPAYLLDNTLASKKDTILKQAGGNLKEDEYMYIATPKSNWDKVADSEDVAWAFANAYLAKKAGGNALPLGILWKELGAVDIGIFIAGRLLYESGKLGLKAEFAAGQAISHAGKNEMAKMTSEQIAKKAIDKKIGRYAKSLKGRQLIKKAATEICKKAASKMAKKMAAKIALGAASGSVVPGAGTIVGTAAGAILCVFDVGVLLWDIADAIPALAAAKAWIKDKLDPNEYRLKLVPKDYQLKEGEYKLGQTEKVYVSNKAGINTISNVLTGSTVASNSNFDLGNKEALSSVDASLRNISKSAGVNVDYSDMDINKAFSGYDSVRNLEQSNDTIRQENLKNLSLSGIFDRAKTSIKGTNDLYTFYKTSPSESTNESYMHVRRKSQRRPLNVKAASEYARLNMKDAQYYKTHQNPRKKGWKSEYGLGACAAGVRLILTAGGLVEGEDFERGNAYEWRDSLTKHGWYCLGQEVEAAEPGDVIAVPNLEYDGVKHFHVEFLADDGIWYSDFKQRSYNPYNTTDNNFRNSCYLFRYPNKIGGTFSYIKEDSDIENNEILLENPTNSYSGMEEVTSSDLKYKIEAAIENMKDNFSQVPEKVSNALNSAEITKNFSAYGVHAIKEGEIITPELTSYAEYKKACESKTCRYLIPNLSYEQWTNTVKAMTGQNPNQLINGTRFNKQGFLKLNKIKSMAANNNASIMPFINGGVSYLNPNNVLADAITKSNQTTTDLSSAGQLALIEQQRETNNLLQQISVNTGISGASSKQGPAPAPSLQPELTTGASTI